MDNSVGKPEIGQWYARTDKGEIFQVVGRDPLTRAIEIQTFDGELDEIEAEVWSTLPLERTEPPEDWTAPMDDIESDDLGYTETDMTAADWTEPLQPIRRETEPWEETEPEEERNAYGEGTPEEPFIADMPEVNQRAR